MKKLLYISMILGITWMASGELIFEFSGYVDSIDYNNNNVIDVAMGQQLTGWFSYEIVSDQDSSISGGDYFQVNASMSMTLGNQTVEYLNDFVYLGTRNNDWEGKDNFSFMVDSGLPAYAGLWMHIILDDSTGTAFSSDELPTQLDLTKFDSKRFLFAGNKINDGAYDYFDIKGALTHLTVIPEPTTLSLLALGAFLAGRRKRV